MQRYGFLRNLQAIASTFFQKNCRLLRKFLYYNYVTEHIFFLHFPEGDYIYTLLYIGMQIKGIPVNRKDVILLRSAQAERSLKIPYLRSEDIFGHRSAQAERKTKKT